MSTYNSARSTLPPLFLWSACVICFEDWDVLYNGMDNKYQSGKQFLNPHQSGFNSYIQWAQSTIYKSDFKQFERK